MTTVLAISALALGVWAFLLRRHRRALAHDNALLRAGNEEYRQQNAGLYQLVAALHEENAKLHAGNAAYREAHSALQQHGQYLSDQLRAATEENQRLAPYRAIVDVDAEVERRRSEATATLGEAHRQAAGILANAHAHAQMIAGEALDAKRNLEVYRLEEKAIRNRIAGYGDQYMVRGDSVLDGLADGYGHAEAGVQLKAARAETKFLAKSEAAADCDYVDPERRSTAIAFVLDAFDGKVDSLIARAKVDNYGTLRQQIIDEYALVNKHGRAFRNARITQQYRESRLAELRWTVAIHELRQLERDEQRRMKEQIREEEKARREYERAQKEAAKEEDVIRRAMEKAQRAIVEATDSQRAKYEAQLQDLQQRLHEAEEKNQRAISMAQQTKRGHVYIISNVGSFGEGVFKIGLTRRLEPRDRVRELGDASVPFEFDVHAMIPSDDAPALERALHRHFLATQINKVNPRKEFFRSQLSSIREEVDSLGISAVWTMTAAATQFRESQAIERAINADPTALKAWLDHQLVLDPVSYETDEEEEVSALPGPVKPVFEAAALQEN